MLVEVIFPMPRSTTFSFPKSPGIEGTYEAAMLTPAESTITVTPSLFQMNTSSKIIGAKITVIIILQQAVEEMIKILPKPIAAIIHKK